MPSTEPIPRLGFRPPEPRVPGFEVVDLADMPGRMRHAGGLHRVDFHAITLVTGGTGERAIDFVTHPCRRGTLLWARPGQVQRFVWTGPLTGVHVLFTPDFSGAGRLVDQWYGPVCWQLGSDYDTLSTLFSQLRAEFAHAAVSPEILQLLLATLLLQIDRLPHPEEKHAGGEVYARFRAELERSHATTRRAEDYATRLGYTVKTLTRACLAATGHTVKHVIDTRVALEAHRLLAHTDEPVATIARRLGFTEPTNFGKFFARHTGTTPGEFRSTHR
jgi:AraC-like DNA-binding protein